MQKPAVLIVHNSYQQRGGEDVVVSQEAALLRARGHRVLEYFRHNDEIGSTGVWSQLRVGLGATWAAQAHADIRAILRREKPDVVHCHNLLPLISPAVYYACRDAGVPVVQTIHNYRLCCPSGTFFRDGNICEECQHGLWASLRHGCYRDSHLASGSVALMLGWHRMKHTWTRAVDAYIAPSAFLRDKMVAVGLSSAKVVLKPNFVDPDPGPRDTEEGFAIFVGRLTPEKGVRTLLEAWSRVPYPLRVIGDGPLYPALQANPPRHVTFLGALPRNATLAQVKRARFLVFPSEWYECFGLAIVEAFACGVPVIGSRLASAAELIQEGRTGLSFAASNAEQLAAQVCWAWNNPRAMAAMGANARREYLSNYTAEANYPLLSAIYQRVLQARSRRPGCRVHHD